ncbi:sulfate adenylyltransferase [Myxococcota bacterium]|nr:sulfate adenylyltransferase [Myxococcota bacterium]
MIEPHGGVLVDRMVRGEEAESVRARAPSLKEIRLRPREVSDLYLIAIGGLSPLTGFMGSGDYLAVVDQMTLTNGLPWSVPITASISTQDAAGIGLGEEVALKDESGRTLGVMIVEEKFGYDKAREARQVYRTEDGAHPGVAKVNEAGDVLVGGPVLCLADAFDVEFPDRNLTPAQTRALFAERGWRSIVAFQTRNPIHRAHEYLTKVALEIVDGLLIHPLVGETKSDDIPAPVRMRCYEALIEGYYPKDRVVLSVLPAAMRYAGPREAIHHCIMRKNYGCTHFIVGRDHAGVGSYYGTYDAQAIFDQVDMARLGVQILKFENTFWCRRTGAMASTKTSPSGPEDRVFLSGTKVREMLRNGQTLPEEFSRPAVAKVLLAWAAGNRD